MYPVVTRSPESSTDAITADDAEFTIWNAPLNARIDLFGVVAPLPVNRIDAPLLVFDVDDTDIEFPLVKPFEITADVPVTVVNVPGAAAVPPIAGGEAR
jgi:hypothetical protein